MRLIYRTKVLEVVLLQRYTDNEVQSILSTLAPFRDDKTLPTNLYGTGSVILNAPICLRSVRVLLYAYAHIARLGVLKKCCEHTWCATNEAKYAAKKQS